MTKTVDIKIHEAVEDGSLVVGVPDIANTQYTELGAPKTPSTLYGGSRQRELYLEHAKAHGTLISAAPKGGNKQNTKQTVKTARSKKVAKLAPTPKEKPVPPPVVEEKEEVLPVEKQTITSYGLSPAIVNKVEENQFTLKFESPLGEISMDVLDVTKSDADNALLVVFRDASSVTFKPKPGDIFDVECIEKAGGLTERFKVFSPNLLYTLPNSKKKVMVLVYASDSEED